MDFVIQVLNKERKAMERQLRQEELMQNDMKKASIFLRNITEIKKATKILKSKGATLRI